MERSFTSGAVSKTPVLDNPEILVLGVLVSVSEYSFLYIHSKWDAEIGDDEPPRFGWLCNWIKGYPEPGEIACHVYIRSGNLRPRIVLEPTDYPACRRATPGRYAGAGQADRSQRRPSMSRAHHITDVVRALSRDHRAL
jgi:hypothetical protein